MEFLALLLCSLVLTARAAAGAPVLDTDGDELRRGQLYYAASAVTPGGGLTLAPRDGSSSCPSYVAQAPTANLMGRPLTFAPENPDDDTVKEGSTLYVTFPASGDDRCAESSGMWQLRTLTGFVSTGGSTSASIGPHFSRFAIRMAGDSGQPLYQISACPCSIGVNRPSCRMGCLGSLGASGGDGGSNDHLLSINSDRPHTVNFVKVKEGAEEEQQQQPSPEIRSVIMRPRPH